VLLNALRVLGDPNRLRILRLLSREELSVAELQEILAVGQSTISMQLAQLKKAGLVEQRRAGQKSLYRSAAPPQVAALASQAASEIAEAREDEEALALVLRKRKDRLRSYFDELAGRFGRHYVPGRSWKGIAELALKLLPPMTIADLGAGEGTLALLLAQRAKKVIAVDHSEKMVAYGREVARKHGVRNFEYRQGDLEDLPIKSGAADLALMHQSLHHALHPQKAVAEARRILKPGGRIVIADLLKHRFEQARELYAHVHLGFSQAELSGFLRGAGFTNVEISVVHREEKAPHFETVLAAAERP
jgi:ArsR family transcriptional regulator